MKLVILRDIICDVRYLGIIEVSSQKSEQHEFFAVPVFQKETNLNRKPIFNHPLIYLIPDITEWCFVTAYS
ncbi:hypothetical protein BpHYR1_005327 [Brachionus plicatilis]|uniref:Uncharacterized protein n=1 Tax=Brachionus plicatilis TaxID=10195 RepID=A0A3M7P7J5_BRAPC|nr:hypothetical protein BpHYR1_005327 [Brachionus plicatilis]